jgi:hypothetical protein
MITQPTPPPQTLQVTQRLRDFHASFLERYGGLPTANGRA